MASEISQEDMKKSCETLMETTKEKNVNKMETKEISEETVGNILLEPTKESPDEIILAQVEDEAFKNALKKNEHLQNELQNEIEGMWASHLETFESIQADIDKFWAIDKKYKKSKNDMNDGNGGEQEDNIVRGEEVP